LLAFLYTTSQFAGLGTMCAITVAIFIKVRKPLRYRILMSQSRGNIITICTWLVPSSLLLSLCFLSVYHNDIALLTRIFVLGNVLYCVLCLLSFFICMPIYISIFCSIRSFMHRQPSSYRHKTTKAAVTFFLIMATYFICIIPVIIFVIIIATDLSYREDSLARDVASCLYILNTVLDPVIYATRIPELKARYKRLFCLIHSFFRRN
jgi:hypothetical protein